MKKDGLVPFAFGDKHAWPAMGTFDLLNFRTNGYDFHVELMAGKESWTDPKVEASSPPGPSYCRYTRKARSAATWQDAAQTLVGKKAGMYCWARSSASSSPRRPTATTWTSSPSPRSTPPTGRTRSRRRPTASCSARRRRTRRAPRRCWSTWAPPRPRDLPSPTRAARGRKDADTSSYTALQKKADEIIGGAKHLTQFMDRDTRPDFTSTVMIPSLQQFIGNPDDSTAC